MLGNVFLILSAVTMAAVTGSAEAHSVADVGASQARKDLNTHYDDFGYLPSRRSFYNYPRHRHIDGVRDRDGSVSRPLDGGYDRSRNFDANYGSAYYGTNYGAPYFGGGYYKSGVYYRERRD